MLERMEVWRQRRGKSWYEPVLFLWPNFVVGRCCVVDALVDVVAMLHRCVVSSLYCWLRRASCVVGVNASLMSMASFVDVVAPLCRSLFWVCVAVVVVSLRRR